MSQNRTQFTVFQPFEAMEFPTLPNAPARIPHIIHQICNREDVFDIFQDPMTSFVENNPTWQYRFWTYESGRKFLTKYYPHLVDIYDDFGGNDVRKSDLLRFAIIHHYGGVYADLDVKNWRSLDKATIKYACIVPTEPFEHSAILYRTDFMLSTAVLLCRPKHPFFNQLLDNLQLADKGMSPVEVTGPIYLTYLYKEYYNISDIDILRKNKTDNTSNSPYFYKGLLPEDDNDALYIPNSQYFMDDLDTAMYASKSDHSLAICEVEDIYPGAPYPERYIELVRRGCLEYEKRKELRKERQFTFTSHFWFHMWTIPDKALLSKYNRINIRSFIPSCILYK